MTLAELLEGFDVRFEGDPHVEIGALRDDSRAIVAGDVFVALGGATVDGHTFIANVAAAGARAVIVERRVDFPGAQAIVPSTAKILAALAHRRLDHPSSALRLVGITGTNGKTTTTFLVESLLAAAGRSPGVIGTVTYRWAGREHAAPFTTPGAIALAETLAAMRRDGVTDVAMECSSHALEQGRLAGLHFAVTAFTNLTQDHLDFHGSMASYRDSKAKLFAEHMTADGVAVILIDREEADYMARAATGRVLRVSARDRDDAQIAVTRSETSLAGTTAELRLPDGASLTITSPLVGAFNLENLVVAVGIGVALGLPPSTIASALATAKGAPGRLERVWETEARGVFSFVDYAHTPDALERVLAVLRPLTTKRLIAVFGCGGDRDRTKRPIMGGIGARLADLAILTSDNPRTEAPESILEMVAAGAAATNKPFRTEVDRRRAIAMALEEAAPGDVVLVAGKGHEDYQIIGKTKYPFDDRDELRRAIATKSS